MKIETMNTGFYFTNSYIISNDKNECVIVDPGLGYKKAADFVCEYFRGYLEHDDDGMSKYVNKLDAASFDPEACTVLLKNTILGSLSITNTICYTNNNCSMLCFSEQLCSEILENLVLRFRLIIYAVTDREFYESIVDENEVKRTKEMI